MERSFSRYLVSSGMALAALVFLADGSWAQGTFSGLTQRTHKVDVVTAWQGCTPPGNSSTNSGFVACLSPQLGDPLCKFTDPRGKGKVRLIAGRDNVSVYGILRGIEPACTGQTMQLLFSARITTDDCPPGAQPASACTLVDLVDVPLGTCFVENGKCEVKGSLTGAVPGLVGLDRRSDLELMGCGFKRISGTSLPARSFSCGIRVP